MPQPRGPSAWHLTLRAASKTPPFAREALVRHLTEQLAASAAHTGVEVHAYCFLPDQLQVVVSDPTGPDVTRFLAHFRKSSAAEYRKQTKRGLWQDRITERRLGHSETIEAAARTVLQAPVRAGLAPSPDAYPFSGPHQEP